MRLTKAEEQIMQILWTLEKATVQDIREEIKDSKPARTTISTILSILETKGFVMHEVNGRSNTYRPLVSKEKYSKNQLFGFMKNYFNSSFSSMASFFAKESNLTVEELDKLLEETRKSLSEEQASDNEDQY